MDLENSPQVGHWGQRLFPPEFVARLKEPILIDGKPTLVRIAESLDDAGFDSGSDPSLVVARRFVQYLAAHNAIPSMDGRTLNDVRDLVMSWSTPWRLAWLREYLQSDNLRAHKLELIVKGRLRLQADDAKGLAEKQAHAEAQLKLVQPPIDLSLQGVTDITGHFATISDIERAATEGRLAPIVVGRIRIEAGIATKFGHYVDPSLSSLIHQFADTLSDSPGTANLLDQVIVVSGSRDLLTQELLRALGYPAAKLSAHTCGRAVDINLIGAAKDELAQALLQPRGPRCNGLSAVDDLVRCGESVTIANLIHHGILGEELLVTKIHRQIEAIVGVQVLDETPFFRRVDRAHGRTVMVSPAWHIQL